jgi:hypothetical protein
VLVIKNILDLTLLMAQKHGSGYCNNTLIAQNLIKKTNKKTYLLAKYMKLKSIAGWIILD